jgi:hypothetical protein
MLQIDEVALRDSIAEQVSDRLIREENLIGEIRKKVDAKVDRLFAERVDALITAAIDAAVHNGFEREFTRVNSWGQAEGQPTTIKKELERTIADYWSTRVSAKNGKPTDSTFDNVSRAEFVMMTVCSDKFSEDMKKLALNVAGHLKDGLRGQLAKQMDSILDELFRVKSLMDQGKVEKPY